MQSFHDAHFSQLAIEHFGQNFLRPDNTAPDSGAGDEEYPYDGDEEYYDEDDGLGYYPDGVKRTLTDEQIAIFRHSEIEALRRAKENERYSTRATPAVEVNENGEIVKIEADDQLSEGEVPSSTMPAAATKKKKKRKRAKNKNEGEQIDLRKRTWDVVEQGLATLDYGEEENEQSTQGPSLQRRRISYDD